MRTDGLEDTRDERMPERTGWSVRPPLAILRTLSAVSAFDATLPSPRERLTVFIRSASSLLLGASRTLMHPTTTSSALPISAEFPPCVLHEFRACRSIRHDSAHPKAERTQRRKQTISRGISTTLFFTGFARICHLKPLQDASRSGSQ